MEHVHRWWSLAAVLVAVVGAVGVVTWQRYDPVQARWHDRPALPSCGSVVLAQGETLRRDAPEAVACLREARESGAGGELVAQWPTTEGDPIRTYYRVTPQGTVEAYEDATADEFGSGDWSFSACGTPSSVLDTSC